MQPQSNHWLLAYRVGVVQPFVAGATENGTTGLVEEMRIVNQPVQSFLQLPQRSLQQHPQALSRNPK
jgi:hypothetical protein